MANLNRCNVLFLLGGLSVLFGSSSSMAATVTGVSLINPDSSKPVKGFNPIQPGASIDLARLMSHNITFRSTADTITKSVHFNLDNAYSNILYKRPFYLCGGDSSGHAQTCPIRFLAPGNHIITVTPYSSPKSGSKAGQPYQISFSIEDSNLTPSPTPSPTASPIPLPTPSPTSTP
jgi:hypothetical protein